MERNEEHRQYPRVVSTHLAYIEHLDAEGRATYRGHARTVDLSLNGVALEAHAPTEPGTTVNVAISLDNRVVECAGSVVRCERSQRGRWDTAVRLRKHSRDYLRSVSGVFADAA